MSTDPHPDHAALLGEALTCHQRGELRQAMLLYRRLLEQHPENHDVLFLSATAETQAGNYSQALLLFDRLIETGRPNAEAYSNRSVALKELKRYDEALESCDMAVRLNPPFPEAWYNRGNALFELKRYDEALQSYEEAIRLKPGYIEAIYNSGVTLYELKRFDEAVKSCERAIRAQPRFPLAFSCRGNSLKELKRYDEALTSYKEAIRLKPDFAEVYSNSGNTLTLLKRYDEALRHYEKAIHLDPGFAEAHFNRANALAKLHRYDEALKDFDLAIRLKPEVPEFFSNRSNTLSELKRYEEAVRSCDTAIRLQPDLAMAFSNRGNILQELNRYDEALSSYAEAIRLKPDFAEAHWNRSLLNLLLGNFEEGWNEYEWRWRNPSLSLKKTTSPQPEYTGRESLAGKRVLLYSEQGYGDTIQFCRYAQRLSGDGVKVFLAVQPNLESLMQRLDPDVVVVSANDPVPCFDYLAPLLSLPRVLGTTVDSIPNDERYLAADQEKVSQWRARLGPAFKPRIGLVWSGSIEHDKDRSRSIPLADLLPWLPDNADCFVLQKEIRESDRVTLTRQEKVRDFSGDLQDFSDSAALIECLDLVVTVDTSAAHLAGALGKPTWLLLPYLPDWRWMLDREDSPWYPSMKLYRQSRRREWPEVLARVRSDLDRLISGYGASSEPKPAER